MPLAKLSVVQGARTGKMIAVLGTSPARFVQMDELIKLSAQRHGVRARLRALSYPQPDRLRKDGIGQLKGVISL